jgi:hypothetical protein
MAPKPADYNQMLTPALQQRGFQHAAGATIHFDNLPKICDGVQGESLPLLFMPVAAADRIGSHRHRPCMHLPVVAPLESPGIFMMSEFVPSFRLTKPLRAVFGI